MQSKLANQFRNPETKKKKKKEKGSLQSSQNHWRGNHFSTLTQIHIRTSRRTSTDPCTRSIQTVPEMSIADDHIQDEL